MPPSPHQRGEIPTNMVVVGIVIGAHGRDGRVRALPESDNPARFRSGSTVLIAGREMLVTDSKWTTDSQILLSLRGIDTREHALTLRGETIAVMASDVPAAPPGSYYHYQLLDMMVVDPHGTHMGKLIEILTTGANDVYVVASDSAELLVPALADIVVDVDVSSSRMTVALPDGLEWRPVGTHRSRPRRKRRTSHG